MPLPYVERTSSTSRGYCNNKNNVTGTLAIIITGAAIHCISSCSTSESVALNATMVAASDTNNEISPSVNLFGKAYRKSSSAKRELSTDKNISTEVDEENNATASDMAKSIKVASVKNRGFPLSLFPPGAVNMAAKAMVTIRAATTVAEDDVSFIHCCASLSSSLCSIENTILGVLFSSFKASLYEGCTKFSTSCTNKIQLYLSLSSPGRDGSRIVFLDEHQANFQKAPYIFKFYRGTSIILQNLGCQKILLRTRVPLASY